MRFFLVLLGALLAAGTACGQTAAAQAPRPATDVREPLEGRTNQKIERVTHEDSGSRIDEVRYAGQTQGITVQPKADVPEYEIQPSSFQRGRPADHREGMGAAGGLRLWNLLRF